MKKRISLALIIIFLVAPDAVFACPLCKDAVARMGEIWTGLGFNWSILFMLAVLISLIVSFTLALVYNYKKHTKKGA